MSANTVIGGDFYRSLALPWVPDPLRDQQLGGGLAWASGELPLLLVVIALLVQWSRQDERSARRDDRRADADGDADLTAYNAMLRRLATQRTPLIAQSDEPPDRVDHKRGCRRGPVGSPGRGDVPAGQDAERVRGGARPGLSRSTVRRSRRPARDRSGSCSPQVSGQVGGRFDAPRRTGVTSLTSAGHRTERRPQGPGQQGPLAAPSGAAGALRIRQAYDGKHSPGSCLAVADGVRVSFENSTVCRAVVLC